MKAGTSRATAANPNDLLFWKLDPVWRKLGGLFAFGVDHFGELTTMVSMPDDRLPMKIHKTPGGGYICFANGTKLYAYGRDEPGARQVNDMSREEAEELLKDVAGALTEAWGNGEGL